MAERLVVNHQMNVRLILFPPIKTNNMFWRKFKRQINDWTGLFNGHFVEVKALYALELDAISCISFIGEIDSSKAFAFIMENLANEVLCTYQHSYYEHSDKKMFFNNTIFLLTNKRMIELGNNYCQVLHTPQQHTWANELIKNLSAFRMTAAEPSIGFVRQAAAN